MPSVTICNETIYYSRGGSGNGPILLFLHGSGGDHTAWPEALWKLPRADVYLIDLPGHGRSSGRSRNSVEDYADFIGLFVSELGLKQVVLAGHSLGGAIALNIAIRAPVWLSRIILVGTGARLRVAPAILEGLLTDPQDAVNKICELSFYRHAPGSRAHPYCDVLAHTDPNVIHDDLTACDRFDVMDSIGQISIPVLIISGMMDKLTPVKYGRYLHERLMDSKRLIIDNCGHMMALEQPDAFIAGIVEFMEATN
jgi:pimeloyl-ACP methyl ester carboxylesterase